MPANNEPRQREIRVFISSTFRDMQEEREELVKQIFPQLRRLCESRGVTWGEVDLRWGIPDEAKAEGKVLPLCLAEIERCRPYFIGLLGERYGWVPEEIPDELLESQPWLTQYCKESVTALEILHGVLLNRNMARHAFFYFREPAYAALHGGFTEEDPARRDRLVALKDSVRKSGFPVAENFATPKQLGEWVLRDITAVINSLYPESTIPDPLDRDVADHEAYAAIRRRVYIGRPEYMQRLDAHAAGDDPPLVVLGESGGGKSALLANWTHRWSEQHPETPVIVHFIGAAPDSADWMAMLRRLLGEFQRHFNIQLEIPDKPDALRCTFANAMQMVAAQGRIVLVLDALNQIEDRDAAPELVWLPPIIPANVRLIMSTLPGRALDDLRKRVWPILTVEPLNVGDRRQLIKQTLAQYAKRLSPQRTDRIADATPTANPLYLHSLIEELRMFGTHEQLDQRIGYYLEARGITELFGRILARWEDDYEDDHAGLVRETMSLIWAARRGLSEGELLDLLGSGREPMPRACWSPLSLAAESSLMNRSGLIGFAHDFVRTAVERRYAPDAATQRDVHLRLADYFASRDTQSRTVDELPWQLKQGCAWLRLGALLGTVEFFDEVWAKNRFEVENYWMHVEANCTLRMVESLLPAIENPGANPDHGWWVGNLLADTGHPEEALAVRSTLADYYRQRGEIAKLGECLNNQALSLIGRGDLDQAMVLLREDERICRQLENNAGLAKSLGNQALILRVRGDTDGAMALHKEAERICLELGDKDGLARSRGHQALILHDRGDLDGAMALHKQNERRCREIGNKDGLVRSLSNQAVILQDHGDLDGAMALHKEQERNFRELGHKDGLQASLGNQALILLTRGDLDGAMALHKEKERICRELRNKDGLAKALGNQALILQIRGDLDGAMVLHKEQERICRELGNKDGLAKALGNQALILKALGDLDEAMLLLKEQERICRELGNSTGLSRSLAGQALILKAWGDLEGAIALHKEEERICREVGDKVGLAKSLGNQALVLHAWGDIDGAMALLKQDERICFELQNKEGLAISLINQALMLKETPSRLMETRRLVDRAFDLASTHGYAVLSRHIQAIRDSIRVDAS